MKRTDTTQAVTSIAGSDRGSSLPTARAPIGEARGLSRVRKPSTRLVLGARDWEVLLWAHEQKFLTFDQLARWFPGAGEPKSARKDAPAFAEAARDRERVPAGGAHKGSWYMAQRLTQLVREGVLKRLPIYTEVSDAVVPGRLGFDLLVGRERSHGLSRLEEIDWKNFFHDRAVTDLRWVLEKRLGGERWRSERELRRMLKTRLVPDALVDLGAHGTVAVEVELTRKSLSRYVRIFGRYVEWDSPRLDRVLYVVPEKSDLTHLFASVLPAVMAKVELWGAKSPNLRRFLFTTPTALLSRKAWWTESTPNSPVAGDL
jgi:hypothetical protein